MWKTLLSYHLEFAEGQNKKVVRHFKSNCGSQRFYLVACGDGLVVSIPAFYSNDPSSNPAGYLNVQTDENLQKEAGVRPSLKKDYYLDKSRDCDLPIF